MTLHSIELTPDTERRGDRVVFCHGLFGQGRNWMQAGKALAADGHPVTLIDMPDHGRSPWSERFDFEAAADQVAELLDADDPVSLVGHSLGGKTAMVLALRHPALLRRLCVVDVSPVAYDHMDEFKGYIDAMLGIDLDTVKLRSDADAALAEHVRSPTLRGFFLQNLAQEHGRWFWRPNLELFKRDLADVGGWPSAEVEGLAPFDGPVLWIAGADSHYITDEYAPAMEQLFPRVRRVAIKDAGHWVHSEQPDVFLEVLRRFVAASDPQ